MLKSFLQLDLISSSVICLINGFPLSPAPLESSIFSLKFLSRDSMEVVPVFGVAIKMNLCLWDIIISRIDTQRQRHPYCSCEAPLALILRYSNPDNLIFAIYFYVEF